MHVVLNFIGKVVAPGLLVLQGLALALAVVSSWRRPERAASLYSSSGQSADSAFVLFMTPLQALVAALMFRAATLILRPSAAGALGEAAFLLTLFSLMELCFVLVRLRANALRGNSPVWRFPATRGVVTRRSCVVSGVLSLLYALAVLGLCSSAS